jgi:outer membrane lipoprotein SlyB
MAIKHMCIALIFSLMLSGCATRQTSSSTQDASGEESTFSTIVKGTLLVTSMVLVLALGNKLGLWEPQEEEYEKGYHRHRH